MAELETHRSVTITVCNERLQIRTDLPDGDLKEIVDYIDSRFENYGRYNLDSGKKMALVALELGQQLSETKKLLHQARVQRDELNNGIKQISALLDEGMERPGNTSDSWV